MTGVKYVFRVSSIRGCCEDVYQDKITGQIYLRQWHGKELVTWLTATDCLEADCPFKPGMVFNVYDSNNRNTLLYQEIMEPSEYYGHAMAHKKGKFSWEEDENE